MENGELRIRVKRCAICDMRGVCNMEYMPSIIDFLFLTTERTKEKRAESAKDGDNGGWKMENAGKGICEVRCAKCDVDDE